MFPLPKGKPEFSKLEEAILQKWKAEKTFEQSVESRPAENPYRFYDGPPFITGTPHYGSLLSSIIKDVVPRYQTMLGKRVERVWGWDCHGMPIEQKVQAKLGLESNKAIEESEGGIQHFIDECYNYTRETSADWSWYIDHIGRWVDMEHAYRTMDQDYMESVMWVFKQIWEKGYVYEGKRVSWYSWKLSTPISNFEIAMDDSYQDVQDPAVTIKFLLHNVKKGGGVLIQDEEGKLLMIKNKKDGLWRFPGGKIEPGESYHAGVARELLEETEITCELKPYCSTYIGYRGEFYEALTFRGVVPVGQKVILEDDKFSEYEYFSLDALPLHSEIHRMEHDLIDFLTGVRAPVIVPEIPEARTVNILAWTTTPWTLPMHMALAVNKDLQYVSVYHAEEIYIVAASRVETVFKGKGDYQVLGTIPGEELLGLTYQPPFQDYVGKINNKNFIIYHADFVTDTDGTGIAHEAPEFGDVDFQLAKQEGIHITSAIDEAGKYTDEISDYQGQLYLDCIDPICERLKAEGTLFKKESITHRVPYCPRSNTPLMQRAQKSWFIDIQRIKGELIAQNEHINWFPEHFKHGRFLKSLESAPDWCISRSRFWGTPMPIWQNTDGTERVVIGSREELYQANKLLGQITKVIVLRHAESEANVAGFYDDIGESPLSEKGKQQAQELVEKLSSEGIDVILSSPFIRTLQTAAPIAEKLGITVRTIDALCEINHGKFGNCVNYSESRESRNKFRADPEVKFGETGESQNDLRVRMGQVAELINREYSGKTVLVVTHGFPSQGLLEAFGKEKLPEKYKNAAYGVTYLGPDGKEINLHRPKIDGIVLPSEKVQNETSVTKVIFLRHAQTNFNTEDKTDNSNATIFTELGEKQRKDLQEILLSLKVDAVYSSAMDRCLKTIGDIYSDKIIITENLIDAKFGEFDGKKFPPENWIEYYNNPQRKIGETGESFEEFSMRVKTIFIQIVHDNPGKTVLISTHGGVINILREYIGEFSFLDGELKSPVPNGKPIIYNIDTKTCKKTTSPGVSGKSKKVLGVHGYYKTGEIVDFLKKTKEVLEQKGIHMDAPFFEKGGIGVDYENWKKVFDTLDISSYDTWITHSMGAKMARQYIVANNLHIPRLILVSPRYEASNRSVMARLEQEQLTHTFEELRQYVDEIIVVNSEDDSVVPFSSGKKVADVTGAQLITVNGCGHFNVEYSPLITEIILHGAPLTRIPEVLDVWMDSASMPYAQVHYPFENMEKMEASFPADFIAEYTGQIRAWFYVMHVLGVLVKGSPAFKNVAVTGVINGTDGRKMSKSYGNYPDPKATIEQYGADALRFYLMGGPIMRGEDMNFSETGIAESLKKVLIPLWNSYTFFATYANIDDWKPDGTEIWFVRHAESQKNVEQKMSGGEDDSPLSEKGQAQVKILTEQVKQGKSFDTIFSTPRKRTIDTISGLGEYIIDEDFLEQDSGEYSGMTHEDIYKKIGVRDVSKMRHAYRWNSVEPWDIFYKRISGALDRVIAQNTGKKILIAAHAGVFRAFTQYFNNLGNEDVFYGSGIKNACLYRFPKTPKTHELDTWILSQLHNLVADTRKHMDNYDTQKACDGFVTFLDGLNNWYIRRNRRRFWRKEVDADKCSAYETLHEVLTTVCQLLAPICPFITEHLYQNLTGSHSNSDSHRKDGDILAQTETISDNSKTHSTLGLGLVPYTGFSSVHLTYFPSAHPLILNLTVNQKMRDLQNLTNLGLAIRGREKLRVRQPLRSASITLDLDESARATLAEELNVKEIHTISDIAEYVTITYSPDAKQIGATERKQWMKTIIADAKAGKGVLLEDGSLEITCPEAPEGKVLLTSAEFETVYTPKEGSTIAFAGNAGYVIGLDTTLDEALTFEGYARDLIRAIQDARKEMGFQVTDRLQLSLTSENLILTGILAAHKLLIEAETLCTLSETQGGEVKTVELDEDFSVEIKIEK